MFQLSLIFDAEFLNRLASVVLLVALDWLFGVIRAIKAREFQWKQIADFYVTSVLPYVLGWMALHVAVRLISILALKDVGSIVTTSVSTGAYFILVFALGAQVSDKVKSVFGRVPGQDEADSARR